MPEELERNARDFELADFVPRDECVKDLFCDVERREVLNLRRYVREGSSSSRKGAHVSSEKLVFEEETEVRGLIERELFVDREKLPKGVADDFEAR